MKKNGFIAMSLIYTFFLVFVVVLLSILSFYLDNNEIIRKINGRVITRYNEGIDGKRVQYLNSKGILKRGDFVNYETNSPNYNTAKWNILKSDTESLYLVSGFVVSYSNSSEYNLTNIQNKYSTVFLNSDLALDIRLLELNDLWQSASLTPIRHENREYPIWNIGTQYFVRSGNQNRIVAPNCACSGDYSGGYHTSFFANDLPQHLTLVDWYSANCSNFANSTQLDSIISTCPVRYLNYSILPTYTSGVRIVVRLKPNVVVLGGDGNYNSPYRIGVLN